MDSAHLTREMAAGVGRLALVSVVAFSSACGEPDTEVAGSSDPCASGSLDATSYVDGERVVRLEDGATISLFHAPQGGYVLMVGAELHGEADTSPLLSAELRDPATGDTVATATRHTFLSPTSETNVWQTDSRSVNHFAHLAMCPRQNSGELVGLPYVLTVELATELCVFRTELTVVPTCDISEDPASCECECSPTFFDGCP